MDRPARYWDVIAAHLPLAFISGTLIAAAFIPSGWTSITTCTFLRITGQPCLFCGGTRSFQSMAKGSWASAFYDSPLAAALFLVLAVLFFWNAAGLLLNQRILPGNWLRGILRFRHTGLMLITLVIANWLYLIFVRFN